MTKFQVRPKDEKESETVQRAMFALGYRWRDSGSDVVSPLFFTAINAKSDGSMAMLDYNEAKRLESVIPIAKAEKIIAEAMRRLSKEYHKQGRSVHAACNLARGQLGIEKIYMKNYFIEVGKIYVDKPVDISDLLADGFKPESFDVFWTVWCQGRPAPVMKHSTVQEAEAEAARLAEKQPGDTFYVLEARMALKARVDVFMMTPGGPK